MVELSRAAYASLYGATTGDQIRLADTDLWIQVEQDLTVGGEEVVFGGGKSIRESMAQGLTTRADGALDTVISNVVVLDTGGDSEGRRRYPRRPDRCPGASWKPRRGRRGPS